jgi:hypothetical protein
MDMPGEVSMETNAAGAAAPWPARSAVTRCNSSVNATAKAPNRFWVRREFIGCLCLNVNCDDDNEQKICMTTIYVVIIMLSTGFEELQVKAPRQAIEGWASRMYNERY